MEKKIIIADDEVGISEMIVRRLKDKGHKIVLALDGRLALKLIEETTPDLLITDSEMPVMDGPELVEQLAQRGYTFPIIFYTSNWDLISEKSNFGYSGSVDYFDKSDLDQMCERANQIVYGR